MWTDDNFLDYELLDATEGERLERWGAYTLVRPDPQVIWREPRRHEGWGRADAAYTRNTSGGGKWSAGAGRLPESWTVSWKGLAFKVKPTGFKHTGLFPEQAANWSVLETASGGLNILNLFAYTGAATVVCAKAGARVTHVDAAKGMVAWAKENAGRNGAEARFIVDDCVAFVERELRRGSRYDGVIMDPPSYGRGPNGKVWKLEDGLYPFLQKAVGLLSDNARFFFLNTYTTGLAPSVLRYLLESTIVPRLGGSVKSEELGLRVSATGLFLPCGATGRWKQ